MQHMRFLHYIDKVAKTGSIRKAAESLNIVSSAVNRRILDIERELGADLFERLPRGVRLTAAGEIYLNYARRQISEMERVRTEIESLSGLKKGEVKLAVIEATCSLFLPRLIADFHNRYPNITFDIAVCGKDEVVQRVVNFEADIGISLNPTGDPKFRPLIIIEQRVKALVSTNHPLASRPSVKLQDCLNYPIAFPSSSLGARALLDKFLETSSIKVEPTLVSDSFGMMRKFSHQVGGVCFQVDIGSPQNEIALLYEDKMIALPLTDSKLPVGTLVLGVHYDRTLPLAAAKFAQDLELALSESINF